MRVSNRQQLSSEHKGPNMKGCMAARNEPANAPLVEQARVRSEASVMCFVFAASVRFDV